MTPDITALVERIGAYLSRGGLFNSEMAEHAAVRDLVIECRDALSAQAAELVEARAHDCRKMTCMGVGDGSGKLFVYCDYDSIKAAQALVFRAESATRQRDEALAALKAAEEALEPFADFAQWVDVEGWTGRVHRESISGWFGPSDFRRARSVLENSKSRLADATQNPGTEQREVGDEPRLSQRD